MSICFWCVLLLVVLLLLLLWFLLRYWIQFVQNNPKDATEEKLFYEPPSAIPAESFTEVSKFILLVSGSYPLAIAIVRDAQKNYSYIPIKDLPAAKQKGSVELFTEGSDTVDIVIAWRALIPRYRSKEFQPDWGFAAIKPFSKQEIKDAFDAIKKKYPNLKEFVFQYLSHCDSDNGKPFLSIRGKKSMKISSSAPPISFPSDSVVADKYFTKDLRDDLTTAFKNADHITIIIDGCEVKNALDDAQPPKVRVVVCETEGKVCNEGMFSKFYGESALLERGVYDNYATKMGPLIKEINGKMSKLPSAAGTGHQEAGQKP